MFVFDRRSAERISTTVTAWERFDKTGSLPGRKRRNLSGASVITVKPNQDVAPGGEVECAVYEDDEDTGRTEMVKHLWGDWATLPANTEHFAVKPRGWSDYVFMIGDICAVLDNLPVRTFVDGNEDYFVGVKNQSGTPTCCRVLGEDC